MFHGRLPLIPELFLALAGIACTHAQTASTAYSFQGGADGIQPNALILAQDGFFYGTTAYGGNTTICPGGSASLLGCGTIFRLNSDGTETVLYSFTGGADGAVPTGLVQGSDGNLYGTTAFGGASVNDGMACTNPYTSPESPAYCCPGSDLSKNAGCGVAFRITSPASTVTSATPVVLKSFHGMLSSTTADYAYPGPMVPGVLSDGTPLLFGTAQPCTYCSNSSGTNGSGLNGALFALNPANGAVSFLAIDDSNDYYPNAVLQGLECPSGATSSSSCQMNLYGTAQLGPDSSSIVFGSVFIYNMSALTSTSALASPALSNVSDSQCDFSGPIGNSGDTPTTPSTKRSESPDFRLPAIPNTIIQQPGSRFPLGKEWSFVTAPVPLTEASDGSILGTAPWACFGSNGYFIGSSCGRQDTATVFQCQPPLPLPPPVPPAPNASPWILNDVYAFSGTNDGAGDTAGLLLASDGNYYISSGSGLYQISAADMSGLLTTNPSDAGPLSSLPPYVSTLASSEAPEPGMIQGSDGAFYGTSLTGGTNQMGAIFKVAPSTTLPAPIQLTVSPSTIVLGSSSASATLTWSVLHAFSMTARQCFAFVQNNPTGAGSWSGAPKATFSPAAYSGSATVTPTAAGTYTYALTCGGTTTGFATLQVNSALQIGTSTLTPGSEGAVYTATLQASGGIGPYTWNATGLPSWLKLSSSGTISGTPSSSGAFPFTVTVKDSESTPVTMSQKVTLTVNSDAPAASLTATPASGVVYGQSVTLLATAAPFPALSEGYTWTIDDGSSTLVTNALSNATDGFSFSTTLSVGLHSFIAVDSSTVAGYASGTSNTIVLNVGKAPTTTSLMASTNSVNQNASVTLTATVASSTAAGTPTGSVQFLSGTTALATVNLSGNTATYTTTFLPGGANTITAAYSGDTNFTGSTSSPVPITVTAPAYSLAANPPSLTVNSGATTTSTITLTPVGGYNGTIKLTCSTTAPNTSCSFNPTSLTANGSNSAVSSTFTFSTNVSTTASIKNQDRPGHPAGSMTFTAGLLASVFLLFGVRRRISHVRALRLFALVLLLFATSVLVSLTACGGSGSSNSNNGGVSSGGGNTSVTPAGNYTVTISASAGSGSAQTLNISVTVN